MLALIKFSQILRYCINAAKVFLRKKYILGPFESFLRQCLLDPIHPPQFPAMSRSIDALGCFCFLSENIPLWMSRVSNLALYISAKKIHVVIHYDGQIQKELEQIVGDIASARNKIRKGKINHLGPGIFFKAARSTGALT